MYSKILDFVRSDIKEHGTTIIFVAKKLGFNPKYLSGILKEGTVLCDPFRLFL